MAQEASQPAAPQSEAPAPTTPAQPASTTAAPSPETLTLKTKDDVRIVATFYPSRKGKEAVPVICAHGFQGKRQDFDTLARHLQENHGCAVIVPDLRGHGESVDTTKKLVAATMPAVQFQNMAQYDLEAVKAELTRRNNEGELNIDKLVVIGSEFGALVAANWTVIDWSWPPLLTGKTGQDVKAMAMISPEFANKGLSMQNALGHAGVRGEISLYVAAGRGEPKVQNEARRVYQAFDRFHKPPATPADRDIFLDLTMDTKLQGAQLLTEPSLGLHQRLGEFVELRSGQKPYPWAERK